MSTRVLVIEDSEDFAFTLKDYLEFSLDRDACTVSIANTGEATQ